MADIIINRPIRLILFFFLFSIITGCNLTSPTIVTSEGLALYLPVLQPDHLITIPCDDTDYNCYSDTLNNFRISVICKAIEDEHYWDHFYSLEYQLKLHEEILCTHIDRVTQSQFKMSTDRFEISGLQSKVDLNRISEIQELIYFYEYICPKYRFRCEISTPYKDQDFEERRYLEDQFKNIRHKIVQ